LKDNLIWIHLLTSDLAYFIAKMEMGGKQKILYEKEDNFIKLMAINQNFGTGSK